MRLTTLLGGPLIAGAMAVAMMVGCKSGTDTNTKANLRPEQDHGSAPSAAGSADDKGIPAIPGDRSGVGDGGVGDASAAPHDAGSDAGTKGETPFDDESSPPPPDAR
ncbi:MAG TPA: hypothetical protein VM261_16600 [Kofleriaceae bacterium]|nr:hypothetical protein [Kofleriaceae bacterium]